eukprot:TRINITY_DN107100_c0_g1_i1.p1 TRINITY_DN107100_c0_g1~~TRINITY_DN107100_c0_g1_i1.p1  ORF type:complete len:473 (+),score=87.14 TRINITY_DN107100_c0_g1_i1:114-1532(+)
MNGYSFGWGVSDPRQPQGYGLPQGAGSFHSTAGSSFPFVVEEPSAPALDGRFDGRGLPSSGSFHQSPLVSSGSFHQPQQQAPAAHRNPGADWNSPAPRADWNSPAPLASAGSFHQAPGEAALASSSSFSFTHYRNTPLKTAPQDHHVAWARNLYLSPSFTTDGGRREEAVEAASQAAEAASSQLVERQFSPPRPRPPNVPALVLPGPSSEVKLPGEGDDEQPLKSSDELEGGSVCGLGCWSKKAATPAEKALAAPSQVWSLGPNMQNSAQRSSWFCSAGKEGISDSEILRMVEQFKAPVVLNVYAVGNNKAIQQVNWMTQNFLRCGGVFHGGIEVFGKEWSYGSTKDAGTGIFCCEPKLCEMHTFRQSVLLGNCCKKPREVSAILRRMQPQWQGADYDLLHKNCCCFSAALAQELGAGDIPGWVNRFASDGAMLHDDVKAGLGSLHNITESLRHSFDSGVSWLAHGHPANEQ